MPNKKLILQIDFRSGLPIYTQIVNQVHAQVASGILEPGDQLPTVRALAEELRVNFNTVARAYRMLDEERIISTQQGRGTYITEIPPPKVSEKFRREALEVEDVSDRVIVMVNGRSIAHTGGGNTPLSDGDTVAVFPIIGGG